MQMQCSFPSRLAFGEKGEKERQGKARLTRENPQPRNSTKRQSRTMVPAPPTAEHLPVAAAPGAAGGGGREGQGQGEEGAAEESAR